ncbi:protein PFC0760c-like [Metopolophium dirhodum]|uniref:protein PFC0760c-like n=1 Tax=Metopolophium dirhodum TaxID=44670 RepID=UPI00298FC938|nr:protein PFC0760c-like [Metopolophium dirhodum]
MKSSNNSKTNIDDISRETQRLISDSHVRLPYHKPKQKSLKDFLNRQKQATEYHVSITGSKKLLHKAWELIENKEQTVEKFYNEESVQEENNEEVALDNSNTQAENNFSLNDKNYDKEITLNENHNNSLSEFNDDEENYDTNSIIESELSSEDEAIDDDEDNSRQGKSLCTEEPLTEDETEKDTEDKLKRNIVKTFIDDEAESSELDCSSDDEDNRSNNFNNESGDEEDCDIEFSKNKKRRLVLLSESSDDDMDTRDENHSNTEIKLIPNLSPLFNDSEAIASTQQLMGFCSGQFQSQQLDAKEGYSQEVDDFEDNFDSEVTQNGADSILNEDDADDNVSLKLVSAKDFFVDEASQNDADSITNEVDANDDASLKLVSAKDYFDDEATQNDTDSITNSLKLVSAKDYFNDEVSQNDADSITNEDDDVSLKLVSAKDYFDDEVSQNDANSITNEDDADDDNVSLKLVSAKDFFDDEAELSESDWSSDDEDRLVGLNDKLEEEEGDKDKLDENIVKDGLDKIYMRQLLDDDKQQVTALKEMLLEDGELYSESNRKRKFQWDDADQNDVKRPLFSDNEDDNEDDVLSDDDKTEQWRHERFKRESYLLEKNKYSDEEESDEESNNILQTSISVVKKTHVVKYKNGKSKLISKTSDSEKKNESSEINENTDETDPNSQTLSTNSTDTIKTNKITTNDFADLQLVNIITSKHNKCIKGSFMKRTGDKLTNTLLFVNKKTTNNDGPNPKKYEEKREMKSLSTITATATSNPFAYLMRNDKKNEIGVDLMKIEKTDNTINLSKTSMSVKTTSQLHQEKIQQTAKLNKSTNSILKQFE